MKINLVFFSLFLLFSCSSEVVVHGNDFSKHNLESSLEETKAFEESVAKTLPQPEQTYRTNPMKPIDDAMAFAQFILNESTTTISQSQNQEIFNRLKSIDQELGVIKDQDLSNFGNTIDLEAGINP